MDLMRDMEFENENQTAIVVSSPSTTSLTPKQSAEEAKTPPQTAPPRTTTPTHTTTAQTKSSHTTTTAPTLNKKISAQQTTPTKKPSHLKNLKTRTLSQSAISSLPGTSKSGSGSLHSSSGVTSPSHRFSVTSSSSIGGGTRQRVSTFTSGTKPQFLAQHTGSNLSSPASSDRGSAESIPSSSSKEKKITSPSRNSTTKL